MTRALLMLAAACAVSAHGQAMMEHALGSARAAPAAAAGRKTARKAGSVAGAAASRTLQRPGVRPTPARKPVVRNAPKRTASAVILTPQSAVTVLPAAPAAPPPPPAEDAAAIVAGISREELVRRFGAPAIATVDSRGETCLYVSKTKGNLTVVLRNGEVAGVTPEITKGTGAVSLQ